MPVSGSGAACEEHHAALVCSCRACLCRTQSGQQAPHVGRPPLGRAPSTPPLVRAPSYPLARQPSPGLPAPYTDTSSPGLTIRQTSPTSPPPAPASQPGPVAGSGTSASDSLSFTPGGSGSRSSKAPGRRLTGSDGQSGRSSLPAPSSSASWLHSQSAQQLTANVKQLAAQVSLSCVHAEVACGMLLSGRHMLRLIMPFLHTVFAILLVCHRVMSTASCMCYECATAPAILRLLCTCNFASTMGVRSSWRRCTDCLNIAYIS